MRRINYLFGFLLTVGGSLSTVVKTNESESVTLDFQVYCSEQPISIVNKNNVTVATCSSPLYSTINQVIFTERYSIEPSFNTVKINITNITISDAGTYNCTNSTHFIPGCSHNLLVFRKPDPPRIPGGFDIPNIGGAVSMNCKGTSRSAPAEYFQNQSMEYKWFVDDVLEFTGDPYTFSLTESLRNKSISCAVQDSDEFGIQSDASEPLILLPKATATLGYMNPLSHIYKALKGSSVTLTCSESRTRTPPISRYRWTRNNEPLSEKGRSFVIARVETNHAGEYECQAENSEGRSNTITKTLQVLVDPVLTTDERIETSDGHVELKCSSSLNDQDIVWFKSGSMDILHVGSTFNAHVTKSTNFTCQVSAILTPTIGSPVVKGANSTISVIYKYSPIRKTHPLQREITYNRYVGHQFAEAIEYDAYPEIADAYLQTPTGLQTKLSVKLIGNTVQISTGHLTKEDCTSFQMEVQNTEGEDHIDINIRCYPHAPSDVTAILSVGQVTLKWTPGFDGGHNQVFRVHQSVDGKSWKQYYSSHDKNEVTGQIKTVVMGLSSEKIQLFKVIADNGLSSDDSNIAFTFPKKEKESDSGPVIGGAISGVVIFIVIAIGIFIYCRFHFLLARQTKNGPTVKESDYARPVARPAVAADDLKDYDTIQKCQYENINYNTRTDHIGGNLSSNHYENLRQPRKLTMKPQVMPKPVKPKPPSKPNQPSSS